ncbi:MAG: dTMP kinase [Candidatus Thermoplasmatota archaeon]
MRGLFVTVEGIDGSGKSTLARGLHRALGRMGIDCRLTQEPTRTWLGRAVRRSYTECMDPLIEAHLFIADRAAHTAEIAAMIERGVCVISDRYIDSTLAYQGAGLAQRFEGGLEEAISWLMSASALSALTPDLTFLLRIAPEEAMKRISARGKKTRFEDLAFLRIVVEAYEILSKAPRFVVLDASLPEEEMVRIAAERVCSLLTDG